MSELWLPIAIAGAVGIVAIFYVRTRREVPFVFKDPREEALTRGLAKMVGCSLGQALTFVQREIDFAPTQSDDTILKRAAYHYRQELPEKTCQVYRERTTG